MLHVKKPRNPRFLLATIPIAASAILAWNAIAQTPPGATGSGATGSATTAISGDVNAGAEIFDSVCEECHGAAATAPTLRGIIGRHFASIESFDGYSDALKAKRSLTWT